MGYLDDEVQRLQSVLDSVEGRLKRLEERQFGSSSSTAETVRMILIGPPGAGMWPPMRLLFFGSRPP